MHAVKAWLPSLVWLVVIFLFSNHPTISTSVVNWQDFLLKKTAHFVEYFILSLLLFRSLNQTTRLSKFKVVTVSFFFSVIYALSDEYHQSFVPGRGPHIRDVFIDTLGAATAQILIIIK